MSDWRQDGLVNCVTGLGDDELDTSTHTRRTWSYQRSVWDLEQEFIQNWMAAREVSQLPWDMFREGFDLVGLPEGTDLAAIMSYIEGDFRVRPDGQVEEIEGINSLAHRLRREGDKLGGAVLLPIVDDGLDPIEPLDLRRIRSIKGWVLLDRSEITPWAGYAGVNTRPEYFVLSDVLSSERAGKDLQPGDIIHRSRLIIHEGVELSTREMRRRNWWGASVLEKNERQRRGAEEGEAYANTYLDRASWLGYWMSNLNEMLAAKDPDGNPVGEEIVSGRMRTFRTNTRTLGVAVLDGGSKQATTENGQVLPERLPDKIESVSESAGDLPGLVRLNWESWQMGSTMPKSIAFGDTVGGLNSGANAGDWQSWSGFVHAHQVDWGTPIINMILLLTFAAHNGPTNGVIPETWQIVWRPLLRPSPLEKAQIAKAQAEADNARIGSNTVKADEVRKQRMELGDLDGPLRVEPEEGIVEDTTGLPPAQVGIATASLEGGVAVGEGRVTEEFLAGWLTSIDEERYPPEKAAAMAASAVQRGVLPTGPDGMPADEAQDEADAEAEEVAPFSNDPRPSDLMSAKSIAEMVRARFGADVNITGRKITNMGNRGEIRWWPVAGAKYYSQAEAEAVLGMAPEGGEDSQDQTTL